MIYFITLTIIIRAQELLRHSRIIGITHGSKVHRRNRIEVRCANTSCTGKYCDPGFPML